MPITQMTREEYKKKYGAEPNLPSQGNSSAFNQQKPLAPPAPKKSFTQNVVDTSTGFVKGLASTVFSVDDAVGTLQGRPLVNAVTAALDPNRTYSQVKEQNSLRGTTSKLAGGNLDEKLKAKNTGEKVGKGIEFAAEMLLPAGAVKKAGGAVLSKVAGKIANPEAIMQRVARIPKGAQAKFEKASGESVGNYLNKRDIYGNTETISQKLYDRFTASKGTADAELSKLAGEYKAAPLKDALKELLRREGKVSTPNAKSPEYEELMTLARKYNERGLNMTEINKVKRMYERNVKLDYLKQNLPEGVARANNIDNAIREWQFKQADMQGLTNLGEINRETRLAKQLLDDLGRESAGGAGNNAITLTDYVLLAGGDPSAIGAFLIKKGLSSKGLQSAIAKKLYNGERIGMPKGKLKPQDFNLPALPSGKSNGVPNVINMGSGVDKSSVQVTRGFHAPNDGSRYLPGPSRIYKGPTQRGKPYTPNNP